jgi:hypothetical protein
MSFNRNHEEEFDHNDNNFQPSDAAFFFSLVCFVPWMKVLSIPSTDCHLDDGAEEDEVKYDVIDDENTNTLTLDSLPTISSSLAYQDITSPMELSTNSLPSSSLSKVLQDSSQGWSIFQSRRKNSLDDSSSLHSMDCSSPRSLFQRSPVIVPKKQYTYG